MLRRSVGGPSADGSTTLLFFLSPTCPVCKRLLPALRSLVRHEAPALRLVLASDGPRDEHEAFVRDHRLDPASYVLSPALEAVAPRFYNRFAAALEPLESAPVSLAWSSAFLAVFTR